MEVKALLFDFDGLILETEGPIYHSWMELYRSYGVELPFARFAETIGTAENTIDLLAILEEQLGHPLPRDEVAPRRRAREDALIAAEQVMPGVLETLESARALGLKLAIVSSSSRRWVEGHLTRLGLPGYFERLITGDMVQRAKPDPELYLAALKALGSRADQAAAFEDSLNGILAAKGAGIFCVAIPTELTRRLPLEQADLRLDSLADLSLQELLNMIQKKR